MPSALFASSFRNPLGNGFASPANDDDGHYVAFGSNEPNPGLGKSHHLGADWNGKGGGNTDLGEPVQAIGNATDVAVISYQGGSTTGFGNYVRLRHDFFEPKLANSQSVTHIHSLYAHLDTVEALFVGQQIGIGEQIGTLGFSGNAEETHRQPEIEFAKDQLKSAYRDCPSEEPPEFLEKAHHTPAYASVEQAHPVQCGNQLVWYRTDNTEIYYG